MVNLDNLPDKVDGRDYIGEALELVLFIFMLAWLTSAASPIPAFHSNVTSSIIAPFEFILIIIIPLTLAGLVKSFMGGFDDAEVVSGAVGRFLLAESKRLKQRQHSKHRTIYKKDNPV